MLSVLIDLNEKEILIVGAGKVAARKVKLFLREKSLVTVISDEFNESFRDFEGSITMIKSSYDKKYLSGKFLVIAATNNSSINREICEDAKKLDILYNAVDKSIDNAVMFQSSMQRGDLVVSVSTSGTFAGLSKNIKKELEDYFPDDYGDYVDYLAKQRDLIKTSKSGDLRNEILNLLELTYSEYKKLKNNEYKRKNESKEKN